MGLDGEPAEVRRLSLLPGETLLVTPPAGVTWSPELCDRLHRAITNLVGPQVLVFSAHVDLNIVEAPAETPEEFAALLRRRLITD